MVDFDAQNGWNCYRKLRKYPRVSGIGRFLRRTDLDELSQILNALPGQMSLAGSAPRRTRGDGTIRAVSRCTELYCRKLQACGR
ncbi:sugar transferase [Paracidobacterium acidisoli]|uniref:sugar transferase n=1 Tax=Paracidobacterium acidisoli TaxID=2303751 RepID=UPI0033160E8D